MNSPNPSQTKRPLPPRLGALIEFTGGDEKGRKVPLTFTRTVLGRKFGDILVRDIKVSSSHAAIEFHQRGFRVVDLGSSNGTFLGKKKIRQAPLVEHQDVRIGLTSFQLKFNLEEASRLAFERPPNLLSSEGGLVDLLDRELMKKSQAAEQDDKASSSSKERVMELALASGSAKGKKWRFEQEMISIGRVQADLNLPDPDVSRKHALIERLEDGQIVLRDLASQNGTFVNEQRITNRVLHEGDRIRMGKSTLIFSEVGES